MIPFVLQNGKLWQNVIFTDVNPQPPSKKRHDNSSLCTFEFFHDWQIFKSIEQHISFLCIYIMLLWVFHSFFFGGAIRNSQYSTNSCCWLYKWLILFITTDQRLTITEEKLELLSSSHRFPIVTQGPTRLHVVTQGRYPPVYVGSQEQRMLESYEVRGASNLVWNLYTAQVVLQFS